MSVFDTFANNQITVRKRNGDMFENIKAVVTPSEIVFDHQNVLLEVDDLIETKLSNGAIDTYEVLDPCFYEAFHSIAAHYQAKVRKLGVREAKSRIQSLTINVTGDNARVNSHSTDNSINIAGDNNEISDLLIGLREAVQGLNIEPRERDTALELVDGIEEQAKSAQPNKSVMRALLDGLPVSAQIASIIAAITGFFAL